MNSYTVEELYRLAQDGNTEALVKLGVCYKEGTGVTADYGAAARCFFSAAKAGNASGQYQLARCYEEGAGIEKDGEAAAYWYREAAKRFYEAARLGNPQAQYGLANCYSEGHGVEADPEAAVYWYQAAAQQDYADAQYNLGYCYLFGIGVEANDVVALKWYQSAASHGDPQMQHNLGLIYKNGYGTVSKNYGKAAEWFFKSARQGYSASKMELALIYFRDPSAVKDVSVAERLMTEAAEDGIAEAQIYLMHYYFDRDPARKNMRKAYIWASKAASQSDDPSIAVIIGTCYAQGELFERDEKQAYEWLSGVENDPEVLSGEAAYYLGSYYQEGRYAAKSYEKASYFYELSQKKGCRLADQGLESLRQELARQSESERLPHTDEPQEAGEAEETVSVRREEAEQEDALRAGEPAPSPKEVSSMKEAQGAKAHEEETLKPDLDQRAAETRSSAFSHLKQQIEKNRKYIRQSKAVERQNAILDEDDQMLIQAYEDSIREGSKNEADREAGDSSKHGLDGSWKDTVIQTADRPEGSDDAAGHGKPDTFNDNKENNSSGCENSIDESKSDEYAGSLEKADSNLVSDGMEEENSDDVSDGSYEEEADGYADDFADSMDEEDSDEYADLMDEEDPDGFSDGVDEDEADAYTDLVDEEDSDEYADLVDEDDPDAYADLVDEDEPDAYADLVDEDDPDAYADFMDEEDSDGFADGVDEDEADAYADDIYEEDSDEYADIMDEGDSDGFADSMDADGEDAYADSIDEDLPEQHVHTADEEDSDGYDGIIGEDEPDGQEETGNDSDESGYASEDDGPDEFRDDEIDDRPAQISGEDGDLDEDWEFPSTFSDRLRPVGSRITPVSEDSGSGSSEKREKRPPVMLDHITDMEDELVDYDDSVPDFDPDDEDSDEWESSDDSFIAALLATGARVTNTSMATPRKPKPKPEEAAEDSVEPEDMEESDQEIEREPEGNTEEPDELEAVGEPYYLKEPDNKEELFESEEKEEAGESFAADKADDAETQVPFEPIEEEAESDHHDKEQLLSDQTGQSSSEKTEVQEGQPELRPVRKLELIIDEGVADEEYDEPLEAPNDVYDEISAASSEPISKRLSDRIPIHEVNVDTDADASEDADNGKTVDVSVTEAGRETDADVPDAAETEEGKPKSDQKKPKATEAAEDMPKSDADTPDEAETGEGKPKSGQKRQKTAEEAPKADEEQPGIAEAVKEEPNQENTKDVDMDGKAVRQSKTDTGKPKTADEDIEPETDGREAAEPVSEESVPEESVPDESEEGHEPETDDRETAEPVSEESVPDELEEGHMPETDEPETDREETDESVTEDEEEPTEKTDIGTSRQAQNQTANPLEVDWLEDKIIAGISEAAHQKDETAFSHPASSGPPLSSGSQSGETADDDSIDYGEKEPKPRILPWFLLGVLIALAVLAAAAAILMATGNWPERWNTVFQLEHGANADGFDPEAESMSAGQEDRNTLPTASSEDDSEAVPAEADTLAEGSERTPEENASDGSPEVTTEADDSEKNLQESATEIDVSEKRTENPTAEADTSEERTENPEPEDDPSEKETEEPAAGTSEENTEEPTTEAGISEENTEESETEANTSERETEEPETGTFEENTEEPETEADTSEENTEEPETETDPSEERTEELTAEETKEPTTEADSSVEETDEPMTEADASAESPEETEADPLGSDPAEESESASNQDRFISSIPEFSDQPYTEIEVPVSGCVYAKLGYFDEKNHIVYAGKPTAMDMSHVAEFADGMNVIGETVYYYLREQDAGTVYSVPETGGELQALALAVDPDSDKYIMNNSIFAGNREYIIGENAEGIEWDGVSRFLTFSAEHAYYLTTDGVIGRETYDRGNRQLLELPFAGEDISWAQVIDRYLLIYYRKNGVLYSYDMQEDALTAIPLEGIEECSGLAANGNWVYGIRNGSLVRVRPNGSGLETILDRPSEGNWTGIVHAMEDYLVAVIDGREPGEYLVDLTNHQYALINRTEEEASVDGSEESAVPQE